MIVEEVERMVRTLNRIVLMKFFNERREMSVMELESMND